MSVNGIGTGGVASSLTLNASLQIATGVADAAGGDATGSVSGASTADNFRAFVQSILQTLDQLGVNSAQGGTPASTALAADPDGDGAAGKAHAHGQARHAVHGFMPDLFQALSSGSSTTTSQDGSTAATPATGAVSYTNLGTDLDNLLQDLGGGAPQSGPLATLDTAFQNLVQTLGGTSSTGNTPTLQGFLEALKQNLASPLIGTSTDTLGSVGAILTASA